MNRAILRIGALLTVVAVAFPPCRSNTKTFYGYSAEPKITVEVGRRMLLDADDIVVPQYLAQIAAVAFVSVMLAWAFGPRKQILESSQSTPRHPRD